MSVKIQDTTCDKERFRLVFHGFLRQKSHLSSCDGLVQDSLLNASERLDLLEKALQGPIGIKPKATERKTVATDLQKNSESIDIVQATSSQNNWDKERQGTNPPAPGFPHQVNAGSSLPQLAIWWASVHQCSRHHLVQRCAKMCKVMQSAQKCQKVPKSSSVYLVALADTTFGEFSFESLVIRFDPVKEQEPEDRTTLLLGSAVDLNSTWTEQCSEWACKACKASKSSMRCSTVHERKELTGATRFHTVHWQDSYVRHTIQSKGPKVSIASPNLDI